MIKKSKYMLFLLPVMIVFAIVFLYPILYVLTVSLTELRINSDSALFVGFDNYIKAFKDRYLLTAFWNTVTWILLQCIIHVGLAVLTVFVLYKKPKGWRAVRIIGLLPCFIPGVAIAVIYSKLYNPDYGLLNVILGTRGVNWLGDSDTAFLALTAMWLFHFGISVQMILTRALKIPQEILEASEIDGATSVQKDFYITFPIIRKFIGVSMVFSVCNMLQLFDIIYLTTNGGPGKTTLNLALYNYKVFFLENNYGYACAVSVIIILLGILFSMAVYLLMIREKR